ncbi:CPSF A subunit region-domain-containing protein [Gloeopeniophorella convolvens]|nr:CPSF A subunit region-domain-containing protein [Gloeopeniophorella convolvens]
MLHYDYIRVLQQSKGKEVDQGLLDLPLDQFGHPRAEAGTWGSCVRIVDPVENKTVSVIHLDNNEAAFSLAVVPFEARNNELHLVVGTAQDTLLAPRSCTSGFLRVYKFTGEGTGLEMVHKTEIDDVPLALLAFQGRLVGGVGKALRVYDIGKKKMLRKAENKSFGSAIVTLNTQGSRILVGDMQESMYYAIYKAPENRLLIFADDSQPRWITCSMMVNYSRATGCPAREGPLHGCAPQDAATRALPRRRPPHKLPQGRARTRGTALHTARHNQGARPARVQGGR